MKEKILLIGGAGFIGSYVCRKLLNLGYEVMVYDSFTRFKDMLEPYYVKCMDIRFGDIRDEIKFHRGDVRDSLNLNSVIDDFKPNRIINLAANPLANAAPEYNKEMLMTKIDGTHNILEAIRGKDYFDRFVYISSSMVYGDFLEIPVKLDQPKKPKNVYGMAKYCGEVITTGFNFMYDIPFSIIRPSAVYGPTDTNRRVSQIFMENAIKGKTLRLDNMGEMKLDFSYVDDVADGIVKVTINDKALGETFNITNGKGYSLLDYANYLKKYYPDLKMELVEKKDDKIPKRGALDISKAKELIGYEPKVDLEEGIGLYVDYYKKIGF